VHRENRGHAARQHDRSNEESVTDGRDDNMIRAN
jgi:hypothetical protein